MRRRSNTRNTQHQVERSACVFRVVIKMAKRNSFLFPSLSSGVSRLNGQSASLSSDTAPTNKSYHRVSNEQHPRTRSCHKSERLVLHQTLRHRGCTQTGDPITQMMMPPPLLHCQIGLECRPFMVPQPRITGVQLLHMHIIYEKIKSELVKTIAVIDNMNNTVGAGAQHTPVAHASGDPSWVQSHQIQL